MVECTDDNETLSLSLSLSPHTHILSKAKLLVAVILGQFLSLLLCGTGVTSQLLETDFNIAVPTTQAFINYAILAAIFGVALAARSDFLSILWKNWWRYALLGFIDVEANYLVILAYKYTNLTSIQASAFIFYHFSHLKLPPSSIIAPPLFLH